MRTIAVSYSLSHMQILAVRTQLWRRLLRCDSFCFVTCVTSYWIRNVGTIRSCGTSADFCLSTQRHIPVSNRSDRSDSLICSTVVKRFYGLSVNCVDYIGFTCLLGIPVLASFPEAGYRRTRQVNGKQLPVRVRVKYHTSCFILDSWNLNKPRKKLTRCSEWGYRPWK